MYNYYLYGHYFESDIKLYNIPEQAGEAEFHIIKTEDVIPDNIELQGDYYYSPDLVCYKTLFADFCIKNGNTILVNPYADANMHLVTSYIIGLGLSYLFSQRGATAYHCTALSMYGKGVMISGISGAGKSTTAYNLINRGHKYLADDVAMLYPAEHFNIVPAFPIQKICGDNIANLPKEQLLYINEDRDKYSYCNIEQFESTPKEVSCIFFISVQDVDELTIEEVTGLQRYMSVLNCLFLIEVYYFTHTPENDKYNSLKLAGKIRFFNIIRPKNKDTLEQISDIIEKTVQEVNEVN